MPVRVCLTDNPYKNSNSREKSQKKAKKQIRRRKTKNNNDNKTNESNGSFIGLEKRKTCDVIHVYSILGEKGGESHLIINGVDNQSNKQSIALLLEGTKSISEISKQKQIKFTYAEAAKRNLDKLTLEKNLEKNLAIIISPQTIQSFPKEETTTKTLGTAANSQVSPSPPINTDPLYSQ